MVDVIGYYDAGREVDDEVPGGQVIDICLNGVYKRT